MLPFTELPPSLLKELGLYVRHKSYHLLEYDFIDITQKNESYNSHLIWCDYKNWYIAHDIYVFSTPNKFEWCYFSADIIFSVEEAKRHLIQLKTKYMFEVERYKESIQNKRLSKLSEDFND